MINLNKRRIDFGKGDVGLVSSVTLQIPHNWHFIIRVHVPFIYSRIQIRILDSNPWNLKKSLLS